MPATIILCILLALAIGAAICSLVRRRREGKFPCGGNCSDCSGCAQCERHERGKRTGETEERHADEKDGQGGV